MNAKLAFSLLVLAAFAPCIRAQNISMPDGCPALGVCVAELRISAGEPLPNETFLSVRAPGEAAFTEINLLHRDYAGFAPSDFSSGDKEGSGHIMLIPLVASRQPVATSLIHIFPEAGPYTLRLTTRSLGPQGIVERVLAEGQIAVSPPRSADFRFLRDPRLRDLLVSLGEDPASVDRTARSNPDALGIAIVLPVIEQLLKTAPFEASRDYPSGYVDVAETLADSSYAAYMAFAGGCTLFEKSQRPSGLPSANTGDQKALGAFRLAAGKADRFLRPYAFVGLAVTEASAGNGEAAAAAVTAANETAHGRSLRQDIAKVARHETARGGDGHKGD